MDAKVSQHTQEAKNIYSISKESNKFAKQRNVIPKEIDITDKAIEPAKV